MSFLGLLHAPIGIVRIMTGEEILGLLRGHLNKITEIGQKGYVGI